MFLSQKERKRLGGSCFVELQYCRLPVGTPVKKIVSAGAVEHWKDDSLYVYGEDQNDFFEAYSRVLTDGLYSDLQTGTVDLCGINYYPPESTDGLIKRLLSDKPTGYERLVDWLGKAGACNGFYILGV